jgi:transcriptional regulator with XRE-family HTH domain
MDLREYLFREKISNKEFASRVGYGPHYIGMVKNGRYSPGASFRLAISKATNGKVNDFPPLKARKNPKKRDENYEKKTEKGHAEEDLKKGISLETQN